MKRVYIIRHADKDKETGQLTETGRKRAEQLRKTLGDFEIIITSNRPRTVETALLLTGKRPEIDARAGFVYSSKEQEESLRKLDKYFLPLEGFVVDENVKIKRLT